MGAQAKWPVSLAVVLRLPRLSCLILQITPRRDGIMHYLEEMQLLRVQRWTAAHNVLAESLIDLEFFGMNRCALALHPQSGA